MTPQESGAEIRANALFLEGIALNAKTHTARDIAYVLGSIGRAAIVENIESKYLQTVQRNPGATVMRPSVRAINLGPDKRQALTDLGQHNRTNIHRSIIEINSGFHDHWRTILGHNFTPEVRSNMGGHSDSHNWLMLRNPETDPQPITPLNDLPVALGFIEPAISRDLKPKLAESLRHNNEKTYRDLYDELKSACYESVDRQSDTYGDKYRSAAQIGMVVELAKLGVELKGKDYLLNPDGYTRDIQDARDYAYNIQMDDICSLLNLEINRIQILRYQTTEHPRF